MNSGKYSPNDELHIIISTHKGNTLAWLYEGKNIIKLRSMKLSADENFDLYTIAKRAIEELLGNPKIY